MGVAKALQRRAGADVVIPVVVEGDIAVGAIRITGAVQAHLVVIVEIVVGDGDFARPLLDVEQAVEHGVARA